MYMKAGDPFTGRAGIEYAKDGEVEQCDVGVACRFGWVPADALAEAVAKAIPEDPPARTKKSA